MEDDVRDERPMPGRSVCRASCFGLEGLRMDANTCQTAVTGPTFEHTAANSFLAAQRGIDLRFRTQV
jgi:hypothetical protein